MFSGIANLDMRRAHMASARFATSHATLAGATTAWPAQTWVASAFEQALAWLERVRQRRQLQQLGDHMLKDIGLSRADVEAEASKPFWRA
jgi:uncharacterized protein YjiS (DUF1127 family)